MLYSFLALGCLGPICPEPPGSQGGRAGGRVSCSKESESPRELATREARWTGFQAEDTGEAKQDSEPWLDAGQQGRHRDWGRACAVDAEGEVGQVRVLDCRQLVLPAELWQGVARKGAGVALTRVCDGQEGKGGPGSGSVLQAEWAGFVTGEIPGVCA